MHLSTPVIHLNKVGKALEKRLAQLGIVTVRDLLYHFPFRYEDFRTVVEIADVQPEQQVTIQGTIEAIASRRARKRKTYVTEAVVSDDSAQLRVVWFGQPYIAKTLRVGDRVSLSGTVKRDMVGKQMVSPSYEKITTEPTHTARIVPLYPLTAGMTQKQMRFLLAQVMPLVKEIEEWIPEDIRDRADIMPLAEALHAIHFPQDADELRHAERRLQFDELYIVQLRAERIRQSLASSRAIHIPFQQDATKAFVAALPFTLTQDQKVAAWEILQDMEKPQPMNRLLEGDVGSGKTVVAALAAYNALLSGYQVVIMAPTEILAMQHFASFQQLLPSATLGLMTSAQIKTFNWQVKGTSKKAKKEGMIAAIANGDCRVVVGTHALLGSEVLFHQLGLVVVDEQHRFGVDQRKMLKQKSGDTTCSPHFLSMTATPIPRSFALTLYGDLDVSIIKQKPAGRKEIKTRFVQPHHRAKAYGFIQEQVQQGRQVFVICPLIEEAEGALADDKKSVMAEYETLSKTIFPQLSVQYLHGKLSSQEKETIMHTFAAGKIDILVSTSVIEVGVNIPNASVMMIEGADRFGLAQLHQFRGRVGRSTHQSYCLVFSETTSDTAIKRLTFFEQCSDGFALAEFDLQERGPGEVYGTNQSGMMQFRIATMKDIELIKLARDMARGVDFLAYPGLQQQILDWERGVHLE